MENVRIERNEKDNEMINIYTVLKEGKYILWGIVHGDMLAHLNVSSDYLDDDDASITINR